MPRSLYLLIVLARLSLQKDPLNDFCRRFGHQSAVVDNKLFLDGGFVNWNPISQNQQNLTNPWLLYNDLSTSPLGVGMPQLYANASKNSSMPSVSGGVLWADEVNKRFYSYGGEYTGGSTPDSPNLLSYDAIYNQWESFGAPNMAIDSVSWGAGVGISDIGQGYMLGGWLSNNSVPGWSGDRFATNTLVKYQMDGNLWSNNTGPDSNGRAEGVMVYLPASETGLLVYFGGLMTPYGNSTTISSPMTTIYIYDIASAKWYSQTAGGDVPGDRRRFCAGAAWAPDQSSYNIYLYGGLGFGANATGYDDVYILSLPSFQWIKWWEGSPPGKPHHSLTCNVVQAGQMLIIGGTFPLSDDCDSPPTWGTHNLDLGKQSGSLWSSYNPNITAYVVPPEIVSMVGGSSLGAATATAPSGGFANQDLAVYFTQRASLASRSPTRSIPTPTSTTSPTTSTSPASSSVGHKRVLSTGAIIGIAVGGAILLSALFVGICCLIRRHRRKHASRSSVNYAAQSMPQSPPSQLSNHVVSRYQLQANSIPAELSENNYQAHSRQPSRDPKETMLQQVNERDHPAYWHNGSPLASSPHISTYSPVTDINNSTLYSQTSPVPSYSSAGRHPRRPVPPNQTYYSS